MRERFDRLVSKYNQNKAELEHIKQNNKNIEELTVRLNDIKDKLDSAVKYKQVLELVLLKTKNEDVAYKKRRLAFVESSIKENIEYIIPELGLEPIIKTEVYRNKPRAVLYLKDEFGMYRTPKNTQGGLIRQMIAYSSSMSVVSLTGSNKLFLDEAFGASSEENKLKISKLLKKYIDEGKQMFLISQSSSLYDELPRRDIVLEPVNKIARVKSIKDWSGINEDNV